MHMSGQAKSMSALSLAGTIFDPHMTRVTAIFKTPKPEREGDKVRGTWIPCSKRLLYKEYTKELKLGLKSIATKMLREAVCFHCVCRSGSRIKR